VFGVGYAIARIIGEQFRLPDRDIGFEALGLTRGQWLSIAMLAMTILFLFFVLRRRTDRIGGWSVALSHRDVAAKK
jgi:phosphatidylglycerol:prolipoprotein diacylglycerol transferase